VVQLASSAFSNKKLPVISAMDEYTLEQLTEILLAAPRTRRQIRELRDGRILNREGDRVHNQETRALEDAHQRDTRELEKKLDNATYVYFLHQRCTIDYLRCRPLYMHA
jgi:hypothetical protein